MKRPRRPRPCWCRGSSGRVKRIFFSAEHALKVADRRGWIATCYPCPKVRGRYHLTHSKENPKK